MADCGVGSIVWVRRRNGSWWPGKILGHEELSSSLITSPRSGTPVKLLGREDASVDWYNLEKSKRVKPFRCGEFDDCIERAEATQGIPPKKREKYARREDAILHALELERQSLEMKYGKVVNSSNGRRKTSPEVVTSSEYLESAGGNHRDTRSDQLPETLGLSLAEKSVFDQHHDHTAREGDQLSGDDGSASELPRMRGLQDFGLCTAPIRQELPEVGFLTKKSTYAYLPYGSGDYPNDNRTISSQMEFPVSNIERSGYPVDVGEDHISGSTEDTETDCSETDSSESDSDEMTEISDDSVSIELHPKYPRMIEPRDEHVSISSNDDLDEIAFDEAPRLGISKWQLKGKRKRQTLGKRSLYIADAEVPRGYANGRNSVLKSRVFKTDLIDKGFSTHKPQHGLPGLQNPNEMINLESFSWNNQYTTRGYWDDGQEYYMDPSRGDWHIFGGRIMLIDVDLKVQANNYQRGVPMISLMSKLNGHAIVGHPIQVEAVESGSAENLLSSTDYYFPEAPEFHTQQLPSVWRTGRRTAKSRIPRPFLSSSLNGPRIVNLNREFQCDSELTSTRQKQKILSQYPVVEKYSLKKISPSSSQKIRTLSSIASEEKQQVDPRSGVQNYGASKAQSSRTPPTLACIPVKLVFSRLHEELVSRHQ